MRSGNNMMVVHLIIAVAVWWTAKTITNIASKSVMSLDKVSPGSFGANSWTVAFLDMRWIELAFLQHLFGTTVLVITLLVLKKPFWPSEAHKVTIFVAAVANVIGNLATNAGSTFFNSSATQVFKSLDLVITFVLVCLLYHSPTGTVDFNFPTNLSIITMVAGSCAFAVLNTTNNIWSLITVVIAIVSFAFRNIFFKKIAYSKETALQKYAMISISGLLVICPIMILKIVLKRSLFAGLFRNGLISSDSTATAITSVFHFVCNLASISVLQEINPTSHAVLNLARRVATVLLKFLYFDKPPFALNLSVAIGLLVFSSGIALYYFRKSSKRAVQYTVFVLLISALMYFQSHNMARFGTQFMPSGEVSQNIGPQSHLLHCPSTRYIGSNSSMAIFTAWPFIQPVPSNVVTNVKKLKRSFPNRSVHVYCGSSQCVCALSQIKNVTTEFLVVSELVKDTPLEQWLGRHPLNKVLAGLEFEEHLQIVTQLAILWQHGGIYINPMVRMENTIIIPTSCDTGWLGSNRGNFSLDVSCFPKHHKFIQTLINRFNQDYTYSLNNRAQFHFDLLHVVNNITSKCHAISQACPETLLLDYALKQHSTRNAHPLHFGVLSFDQQSSEPNLARDFQALSILQFLPFIDGKLIEGDSIIPTLSQWHNNVTVFFNGKWSRNNSKYWPLSSEMSNPVMVSFCIDNSSWLQTELNVHLKLLNYLKKHKPIGCCNINTLEILRDNDVKAYFSGSLSLMVNKPTAFAKPTTESRAGAIYLIDVGRDIKKMLPQGILQSSIKIQRRTQWQDKIVDAYQIMESYASGKLLVTQSIHFALPCVAMGIPVVFINSADSVSSTVGLTPLFHTIDLYNMSRKEVGKWLHDFDWDNPPPNPNVNMMMRMRATFWDVIRQNQALYDTARKFGTIPLKPPVPKHHHLNTSQLLFHMIFTTSNSSTIKLSKSSIFEQVFNWRRDTVKGGFSWRHWRTVESIFYHHPFAKVIIHSNTLQQSVFDVLTEVGYDVEVWRYKLEELLENSPASAMIEKLPEARKSTSNYWYSHETDLLRFLVLYKWGGVYVDTDVIVVRSFDNLRNVASWEDNELKLNGAVLKFDAGNLFLKAALEEFANNYNGNCWACNGPGLLTRVYKRREENWSVTALKNTAFYMFHPSVVKSQCFSPTSLEIYNANMKILKEEAYAVHLNSKITAKKGTTSLIEGTFCKHLLNSYCVLCNHQY